MVVLNIHLDNLLLFRNFNLCLAYPKKIVNSTIEHEHLQDRPNFRYRKLIILMGANATGKTALGKTLMAIFNFIEKREASHIFPIIDNKTRPASFSIDLAFADHVMYRIAAHINPKDNINEDYSSDDISVSVKQVNIRSNDSYETCATRLEENTLLRECHYIQAFEVLPRLTWAFEYPYASEGKQHAADSVNPHMFAEILKKSLKALEPRIIDVSVSKDMPNSFVIAYPNHKVLIKENRVIEEEKLSSGTKEIIGVAQLITCMKLAVSDFFYCDEKFSHVHSEMEKSFVSVMIELIRPNQQLFFTTHNPDILDMNLPKHSFAFLRRDEYDAYSVSCVFASDYLKKSTDSIRNAVENDLFSSAPRTEDILRLADYPVR